MTTCPICHTGHLVKVDDIIADLDGLLFVVSGRRCDRCGEEILDEQEGQKTIALAKRLNAWGPPLKLRRKLSRSARGTVLRIPADIERDLRLKGNEAVFVHKIGKKIIVEVQ